MLILVMQMAPVRDLTLSVVGTSWSISQHSGNFLPSLPSKEGNDGDEDKERSSTASAMSIMALINTA